MRATDLTAMAVHNLWQRRARSALNLIGVVIGCIIVQMTAAGAGGVKDAIHALFDSSEFARQIGIFPGGMTHKDPPDDEIVVEGDMSDERRERIKDAMVNEWRQKQPRSNWRMTMASLAEIEKMDHVVSVVPEVYLQANAFLGEVESVVAVASTVPDSPSMRSRVLAGHSLASEDKEGALVDEFLAYRLGYRSDLQLEQLVGKELQVRYRVGGGRVSSVYSLLTQNWGRLSQDNFAEQTKFMAAFADLIGDLDSTSLTDEQKKLIRDIISQATNQSELPKRIEMTRTFKIVGVVRQGTDESISKLFRTYFHHFSAGEVYVNHRVAAEMQLSDPERDEFYQGLVTIESTKHLESTTEALKDMGVSAQSASWLLEDIDRRIDQNKWVVYAVAAAILLTAAIGISNTLIISVLERTPEFGILKSVGAKDSDLVWLMIIEGGILGAVGATVAITMSRILALGGHYFLEVYVEGRLQGSDITTNLFQFTWLSSFVVVILAMALCSAASILPAWRAARLDPIIALRRN